MNIFHPSLHILSKTLITAAAPKRSQLCALMPLALTALVLLSSLPNRAQAGDPSLENLPPGVLKQIQEKLPLREQHQFNTISRTLRKRLQRFKHLAPTPLEKDEQHFYTLEQYFRANASGRYRIDAVRLHFGQKDCLQFFSKQKAYQKIKRLWIGNVCSHALVQWVRTPDAATETSLEAFSQWGKALEALTLSLNGDLPSWMTRDLFKFLGSFKFQRLKSLKLRLDPDFNSRRCLRGLIDVLSKLESLEELILHGAFKPQFLAKLPELSLKSLNLRGSQFSTDEVNTILAPFLAQQAETLEKLRVGFVWEKQWGDQITPLFEAISGLKSLRSLDFYHLTEWAASSQPHWQAVNQIKNLKSLTIPHAGLTDEHLIVFKTLLDNNPDLERISIRNGSLHPDSILFLRESIQKLKHLRQMDLSHNPIGALGLHRLLSSLHVDSRLEELTLEGCQISNHYPIHQNADQAALAPQAEWTLLSERLSAMKKLQLSGNSLFSSPGFFRRCLGTLGCWGPTPSILSAFQDSKLTHLDLLNDRAGSPDQGRTVQYALDYDADQSQITHLGLSPADVSEIVDTPFFRNYPIDPSQIRSLKIRGFPARFGIWRTEHPKVFFSKFPNLETIEFSDISNDQLVPLLKILPSGLRFAKIRLTDDLNSAQLREAQRAFRIKGISLYQFLTRSLGY